jgi:hypothetical protein
MKEPAILGTSVALTLAGLDFAEHYKNYVSYPSRLMMGPGPWHGLSHKLQ